MIKKTLAALGGTALALGMILVPAAGTASAASPCTGTWSVVVGGLGNGDSLGFANENQRVGYNSIDTRSGINELNRLIRDHRNACPGDWIKAVGHSGGAAVVHRWATENGHDFQGSANIVLLSDPKRPAGLPGGQGFAGTTFPFNVIGNGLAGTDGDYGGLPALSVCQIRDVICASDAGWGPYLFENIHGRYNLDVRTYSNHGNGYVDLHD